MTDRIWPLLGAGSGILYAVLPFLPSLVGGDAVRRVELIGILFFIPFLGYLWSILRLAEGEGGWLSATEFGAGLIDLAIKLSSLGSSVAAQDLEEGTTLDTALHDMNGASFIVSLLPLGVLTAAFAIVTLKTRVLPWWLGWLAAITAGALLVNGMFVEAEFGPAFLLFLLWTAVRASCFSGARGRWYVRANASLCRHTDGRRPRRTHRPAVLTARSGPPCCSGIAGERGSSPNADRRRRGALLRRSGEPRPLGGAVARPTSSGGDRGHDRLALALPPRALLQRLQLGRMLPRSPRLRR